MIKAAILSKTKKTDRKKKRVLMPHPCSPTVAQFCRSRGSAETIEGILLPGPYGMAPWVPRVSPLTRPGVLFICLPKSKSIVNIF